MFDPGSGEMLNSCGEPQPQQVELEFKTKKKTKKNKRRLSEDQVKWLESLFENETKLEPRQKVEASRELGLNPRQVAIWFQNKRARWKSKLLQRDFDTLRSSYDSLSARFDALKKENLSLSLQLRKLKEIVGSIQEDGKLGGGSGGGNRSCESETNGNKMSAEDEEKKPELAIGEGSGYGMGMVREEGCSAQNTDYLAMEESTADLLAMVEPACSSLTLDEEWHGLQSDGLFDQSPSSCQWWDFWPLDPHYVCNL